MDSEFTGDIFTAGKIVRIIFDLARYNRIPVIAEGVEERRRCARINQIRMCSGSRVSVPETHTILRLG